MSCPKPPCSCLGSYSPNCGSGGSTNTTPPTPCPTGCLLLGTIIVTPEDSVAPCGSGSVAFTCFDYSGCDGNPSIHVTSTTPNITVDSITPTGLDFTISCDSPACEAHEICVQAGCNGLGDIGTILIFTKDLCKGVLCGDKEICNPLTGVCEEICPVIAGGNPDSIYNVGLDSGSSSSDSKDCDNIPPTIVNPVEDVNECDMPEPADPCGPWMSMVDPCLCLQCNDGVITSKCGPGEYCSDGVCKPSVPLTGQEDPANHLCSSSNDDEIEPIFNEDSTPPCEE